MIGKKINQLATELAPVSTDLTIIGDPTTGVSKKITLAQLGAIFSGAVSFYTNLAGFPATGDINVIYCAKDTQKLYLWSGSAYVEVFPSQALLDTYQLRSEKGVSNGYASLDSTGKVPISQLPSSIMEYKGTWNAATNTPTLANGTGDTGDVYICNVAGTVNFGAGPITFAVGDYVIYSGTIWQRSSGAVGTVTSVAASITGNAIGITGSPVTTSGTLAFAFAGTGAQYIKGDGTLATFPSTIAQAERLITEVYNSTGATLTKGTIVYINGGQGNLPTVTKALATGDSTSAQTFGVVQADITNNNNGYVVVAGKLSDLDTQAYTPGTQLYLSSTTAGTWTSTKQYAPNHLVYIGVVVREHPTQGIVEVKIQNGYELDELHNVAAQTPTNNDGLFWESATSLWKNKSIATVLGYTPQPQLSGTGFVKISGTTISYDNSTYLTTSAAASTYLPLVLNGSANTVDINGQQFTIQGSAGGFTSGRIIVDPVFSAIGYQNAGVFDGLKILTNGNAEFTNSGVTRFFNQVRFDSTLTNGTYTYTLPGATGTIALVGGAGVGTVTSVGLSSATSGVTIGSTPITTSGTITLAIATASGSQQGLLSSTDWTTFNNKQNALTNPVTGTGTTNYLPKFTGTSTIGNSVIQEASGSIGINVSPVADLQVGKSSGVTIAMSNSSSVTSGKRGGISWYNSNVSTVADIRAVAVTDNVGTQLEFYTRPVGGSLTQAMTLNASGNLGLGTASPDSRLHVLDAAGNGLRIGFLSGSSNFNLYDAAIHAFRNNGGTSEYMRLNASGNLSIGNTNDTYKLDVSGTGRFTGQLTVSTNDGIIVGAGARAFIRQTVGGDAEIGAPSGGVLSLFNNGSTALSFGATGAATFSSSVRAGGDITYYNGGNLNAIITSGAADKGRMYIYNAGNPDIGFQAGGNSWFTNNVGIGTNNPTQNLEIGGTGNILVSGGGTIFSGPGALFVRAGSGGDLILGANNTNGLMRITSGGLVGIGTSSPYSKLHTVASGGGDNMGLTIENSGTGGAKFYIWPTANINGEGANRLIFSSATNANILILNGSTSAASFSGDVKVKTLEVTNATTYGSSAGISTYMQITVNGNNYVIPLHGTP